MIHALQQILMRRKGPRFHTWRVHHSSNPIWFLGRLDDDMGHSAPQCIAGSFWAQQVTKSLQIQTSVFMCCVYPALITNVSIPRILRDETKNRAKAHSMPAPASVALLATELPSLTRSLFRFYAKATYTTPVILESGTISGSLPVSSLCRISLN